MNKRYEATISFEADNEDQAVDLMLEAVQLICGCNEPDRECKRNAVGSLMPYED